MEKTDDITHSNNNHDQHEGTERKLEGRHLTMIAIGGTIGTGLFLNSGALMSTVGALGLLLAYFISGTAVFFVVCSLGEMATLIPISGSFNSYASRFVDPALGFTSGWNYFFSWVITLPLELQAAASFLNRWLPNVNQYALMAILLAVLVLVNCFAVDGFGEVEYWLSIVKILAIVFFIVAGFIALGKGIGGTFMYNLTMEQGLKLNPPLNLTADAGGPFLGAPAGLALKNIIVAMIGACFSFGGTEIVGITAGEAKNPRKAVPRAINGTFWRIMIFYIISVFLIGLLLPATFDKFQSEDKISKSPFVFALSAAKIPGVEDFMNAICLVAVISTANSSIYASARSLMALAQEDRAPAIFAKTSKNGVPYLSVALTVLIGCIAFSGSLFGDGVVFNWLINVSGSTIIVTWWMINLTHLRFRKAYKAQGYRLQDLPYRALFFPYGCYFGLFFTGAVVILNPILGAIDDDGTFSLKSFLGSFITLPVYLIIFIGWKLVKKTKVVPLMDVDLDTGNINIHAKEMGIFEEKPKTGFAKMINFLA
ncbi:hypothetical protein HDU92_000071 [Lobulomyces angularis]|nr:hypothetical protein HDU92_000071 [Lobulomyces angularis]